jgi:hypothetical protein
MDTVQEGIESEKREQENTVTDEDMAARFASEYLLLGYNSHHS